MKKIEAIIKPFKLDEVKTESFPIIRGKSPMRISFGGGGTDLPVFFKK